MKFLRKYASFIKLEHSLFSLPLLFTGAILGGNKWPSLRVTILILIAGTSARLMAMTLNRIIDRDIDRKNPRTENRHLPQGMMTLIEAWLLVAASLGVYLLSAWMLSDFCLRVSWIPLAAFLIYPFLKRFTKWSHVGLGMVWTLVPLAGYVAVKPSLSGLYPVFLLALFCVFWLAGFDIIYSTLDEEFDREAGLHSLPAAWGSKRALKLSGVFHVIAFVSLVVLYLTWLSGPLAVLLLAIIGVLLYLEQTFSQYVDLAFFQINAIIGFMILVFVMVGLKGV